MGLMRNGNNEFSKKVIGIRKVSAIGVQRVIVEGKDWGPAITKVFIEINDYFLHPGSVDASTFDVEEVVSGKTNVRTVLDAYVCDEHGERSNEDSHYIAIELYVSPTEGSPCYFDVKTLSGVWHEDYMLNTTLKHDIEVDEHNIISSLFLNKAISLTNKFQRVTPEVNKFTFSTYGEYKYAYYQPSNIKAKYPLVIWLHGGGEGGEDLYKCLLGNKVVALAADEFQTIFDGAYILVPQCKTFWMQDETGHYNDQLASSPFEDSLMDLIQNFVANHPIDPDRIIVGGCSNGGYMTVQLLMNHPDYFAAGYPICEGLLDKYISQEKVDALAKSNTGIYFVYSKEDQVFDHPHTTLATYKRLKEAGANVHLAEFDDVVETYKGLQEDYTYKYNGHFSWVKFFNNECENFWQMLSEEHK